MNLVSTRSKIMNKLNVNDSLN